MFTKNEIGWLSLVDGGVAIERLPIPELGNVFNTSTDSQGMVWLELGNGRVGRLRVDQNRLIPEFFDQRQGVPDGFLRLSCGCEDADDLINDLAGALK